MAAYIFSKTGAASLSRGSAVTLFLLCAFGFSASSQTLVSGPSSQAFGQTAANGSTGVSFTETYSFSGTAAPSFSLAWGKDYLISASVCTGSASSSTRSSPA